MGYDRGDSFPFDFEPNGIPFGSKSTLLSSLIQNRKENCHHDHIPFNLKGNEILVFSVYTPAFPWRSPGYRRSRRVRGRWEGCRSCPSPAKRFGVTQSISLFYLYPYIYIDLMSPNIIIFSQSLEPSNGKYLLLCCANTKIKHI